jgi:hypothetical protein
VKSAFFANLAYDKYELPQGSYYKSLEKQIGVPARGEDLPQNAMSAEQFGKDVLRDVLRGKSGNTYSGTLGWAARYMPMVPSALLVSVADLGRRDGANWILGLVL